MVSYLGVSYDVGRQLIAGKFHTKKILIAFLPFVTLSYALPALLPRKAWGLPKGPCKGVIWPGSLSSPHLHLQAATASGGWCLKPSSSSSFLYLLGVLARHQASTSCRFLALTSLRRRVRVTVSHLRRAESCPFLGHLVCSLVAFNSRVTWAPPDFVIQGGRVLQEILKPRLRAVGRPVVKAVDNSSVV